ncbi:hypothetical protein GCM10011273_32920 [Asticcacaulis endophyticus]|uniref:Uncharacterized protein n=1 Tax=Asticcacaulis endophyticus TaxID=1395890 RepID=A0A918QE12_9CAUL|nr:hypothetical protein GCM10011273_32920 [Asticcacaulis endophyticus]
MRGVVTLIASWAVAGDNISPSDMAIAITDAQARRILRPLLDMLIVGGNINTAWG